MDDQILKLDPGQIFEDPRADSGWGSEGEINVINTCWMSQWTVLVLHPQVAPSHGLMMPLGVRNRLGFLFSRSCVGFL